jgi:hypothetical protein
MGAGPQCGAVLVGDGPCVSSPHHRYLSQDGRQWNNIHDLFARHKLINQLGPTLGDPALCRIAYVKVKYINNTELHHITTYFTGCVQLDLVAKGNVGTVDPLDYIRIVGLD